MFVAYSYTAKSKLTANYNITVAKPFDVRTVIDKKEELNDSVYNYTGMVVSVINDTSENNGLYLCLDADLGKWKKLSYEGESLLEISKVDVLPEVGEYGVIYLVLDDGDVYNQWLYVDGAWAKVGNDISLEGYATTDYVDKAISKIELMPGPKGDKGDTGNGIDTIIKTSSNGLIDTYTITFTDSTTTTFTVVNGKDGIDGINGEKGEDGHTPVITIQNGNWFIDGIDTGVRAEGLKGADGNGISSILKTNTEGLVDTYTITYTNGTLGTFTVTNGKDGKDGADGAKGAAGKDGISITKSEINEDGELVLTYSTGESTNLGKVIGKDGVDGSNGTDGIDGKDGIGISTIVINEQGNLVVTLSNNSTLDLGKVVGKDGLNGSDGSNGIDGREVEFNVSSTHVQWKYAGEEEYKDLVALESLKGKDGQDGSDGINGLSAYDIAVNSGFEGDESAWLESLKGQNGQDGKDGLTTSIKIGDNVYTHEDGVVTLPNFITEIPENVVTEDDLSDLASTDYVDTAVQEVEDLQIITNESATSTALGGIPKGTVLAGKTVREVIEELLFPYVKFSLNVSGVTPNTATYEKGKEVNLTAVTVSVTAGSKKVTNLKLYESDKVTLLGEKTEVGSSNKFTIDKKVKSAVSFYAVATDGTSTVEDSSTFLTFLDPTFYGVLDKGYVLSSDLITAKTKELKSSKSNTFTYTASEQHPFVAYPASYGNLTSILDSSNLEYIGDFNKTTMNLNVLSGEVSYNIYVLKDPTDIENYKFIFK